MTLYEAKVNTVYRVVDVSGEGNARRRLLDMGFTPDCKLYVVGIAPFGGTVLVAVRGFTVALREDAANLIEVEAAAQ